MKNMSSSGGMAQGTSQTGGWNLFDDQFRRENQFDPPLFFFPCTILILIFLISSPVLTKLGLNTLNVD
jgi:hypothetical protein